MKPYEQGALDGLCAVYSIVNAARIISGLTEEQSRDLFRGLITHLEQSRDLGKILTSGIDVNTIGALLNDVAGNMIPYRAMPFKHYPDTPLDEFWTEMVKFINGEGRRVILIGLGGHLWDHWSIVDSITEKQIRFFDSLKLKRLNRSRCATIRATSSRPHLLHPTHTYFLA